MSLESGHYVITSQLSKGPVGSAYGPSPSKVVTFPGGVEAPFWKIIKGDHEFYKVTQEGGSAVEIGRLLFLSDCEEDDYSTAGTWKLEHVPQHGKHAYIIINLNLGGSSLGWVTPERDPYTQLEVRPLISTPSLPPRFLPSELFDIVRVDRDVADDAN